MSYLRRHAEQVRPRSRTRRSEVLRRDERGLHVIERFERGVAGYQRIARHTVSAEAAIVITAVVEDDDSSDGQPAEQNDEAEKPAP